MSPCCPSPPHPPVWWQGPTSSVPLEGTPSAGQRVALCLSVIPSPCGFVARFPSCFFFFSFITQQLLWIKCNTYCLLKRSELFIITVFLISDRNDSRKTFFKECKLSIRCISGSPKTLLGVLKVRVWYLEWITNRELLYRTGNSAQCYVAPWMGRELREE